MIRFLCNRAVIMVAALVIVLLNVIHPFIHAFEGGGLDSTLIYMNIWAGFALNESGYDV